MRDGRGELAQQVMRQRIAEVEGRWRSEVGADRYATFRQVLLELTSHYTEPRPEPATDPTDVTPSSPLV